MFVPQGTYTKTLKMLITISHLWLCGQPFLDYFLNVNHVKPHPGNVRCSAIQLLI